MLMLMSSFFTPGSSALHGVGLLVFAHIHPELGHLLLAAVAFESHRPHEKSAQQIVERLVQTHRIRHCRLLK